jgi:hypothetical protein
MRSVLAICVLFGLALGSFGYQIAPERIATLLNHVGGDLHRAKLTTEAAAAFARSALVKDQSVTWNNLATTLVFDNHVGIAVACHYHAIELDPAAAENNPILKTMMDELYAPEDIPVFRGSKERDFLEVLIAAVSPEKSVCKANPHRLILVSLAPELTFASERGVPLKYVHGGCSAGDRSQAAV